MLAPQSPLLLKPKISSPLSLVLAADVSRLARGRIRRTQKRASGQQLGGMRTIRALISSDDKSVGTASLPADSDGSVSSLKTRSLIDVRAVITIRRKMKERLSEMVGDQWESFINGIGKGIVIRLVSEEIDPVAEYSFHHFLSAFFEFEADDLMNSLSSSLSDSSPSSRNAQWGVSRFL
ncbi:hypothetical protein ACLOJK_009121 [Asimina triloba]